MLRLDLIFSYWILFWYILYITKTITCCSPKFALGLALIENIIELIYISFNGASFYTLIKFIIIIICIKIIPYYTVINDKIIKKDIIVTLMLFVIYIGWLFVNNMNILQISYNINNSLVKNKGDTPGIMFIDIILKFFRRKL